MEHFIYFNRILSIKDDVENPHLYLNELIYTPPSIQLRLNQTIIHVKQ